MVDMQFVNPSDSGLAPQPMQPFRVFLVEDSAAIRILLTDTISVLEHVELVGYAETEAEAIAALRGETCDAVVLDLQLKEGNGFNVLKVLRSDAASPRIIVLVLTNHATLAYRTLSLQLGADYFFDKSREYRQFYEALEGLAAAPHDPDPEP